MAPEEQRRDSFLEHLSDSEKRLGASRHSVFDTLFVGVIVLIIAAGAVLGIMRLRAPTRVDPRPSAAPSVATPAPAPADDQTARGESPVSPPLPAAVQTEKVQQRPQPSVSL